jgi:membrane-associated phospholipid phosphatase
MQETVLERRSPVSWYHWGFLSDLLVVIVLFAIGLSLREVRPFERPVDPKDPDLNHPKLENIVTNEMLIVYSLVLPCLIGLIWYLAIWAFQRVTLHDMLYSLHLYLMGVLLSLGLTQAVTNLVKNWAGRLRPDFLDRCKFNETLNACTGDPAVIEEGRRSFFSGHASLSFAGLGFLAFWLGGLVLRGVIVHPGAIRRGLDNSRFYLINRPFRAWRYALPALPLILASYIAVTRTQQYVHHPTDVATGSIIGFLLAALFYFFYYRKNEFKNFTGYEPIPGLISATETV